MKTGDKELTRQINDLRARNETLEQRARWLEELLAVASPGFAGASASASGEPVPHDAMHRGHLTNGFITDISQPVSTNSQADCSASSCRPLSEALSIPLLNIYPKGTSLSDTPGLTAWSSVADIPNAHTLESAIESCNAFLSGHKQSNHIVNKESLMQDLHAVYQPGALHNHLLYGSRFRCFMVLYLAQERYWKLGTADDKEDSPIRELYRQLALRDVCATIGRENIECVQALGLLGLMSIQEPDGPDLWQVVGLAARTAVAIGIHRKDEVHLPLVADLFQDEDSLQKYNECRKDVFWALYSLDRLTMFTLSRPAALRDDDIDVEMPSLPPPSSTLSREVPSAAMRVHSLKGRKLYGQIQESLYTVAAAATTAKGPFQERKGIVDGYAQQVQSWYASSPLRGAFVPISAATVRRQSLDDLQYHQMIMALHRPSPLMPEIPSSFVDVLHEAATISVDLYDHYSEANQVLVNWVHLKQIFTSCTTLVYCFWEYQTRDDLAEVPRQRALDRIQQCKRLLARFGPPWPQTQRYQTMFDNLTQSFSHQQQDHSSFLPATGNPPVESTDTPTYSSFPVDPMIDILGSDHSSSITLDPFESAHDLLMLQSPDTVMRGFWG
ncbi:hypothetical protein F4806DRAFT_304861 [Annulohypoxylon nitens]|nr:hypothetical protein F4806DRAFT_304861 [Annulohypoxylon nitens]